MYILSVCGMGFGTSLMLLMDIQSMAKDHGYTVEGEATDLGSAKGKSCDLIVASSEIAASLTGEEVPVVAIDNLLDKDEIKEKVLPLIERLSKEG
ncbi:MULTISPECIES: PTS sugar transporter subunit IIB [Oceanobacillus]|uniref:PTS lactose transporter subunit IIB n=1 Tax=Oceanobacillus neutriphilus TaxID=531815 RepID=A0ABQ2NQ52_9BACI|nr:MULTISPECIES: PTS sugar transporter subunit IIB [Oceanobacillus]MCT1902045.1 PTS sugar transporter subunit IIB [Oceanobacillus sojae]GGP07596.1 PTS lactose transporter subunit IIB [Oceanobacillus neutriphilus]